jgi:hypothetical protein
VLVCKQTTGAAHAALGSTVRHMTCCSRFCCYSQCILDLTDHFHIHRSWVGCFRHTLRASCTYSTAEALLAYIAQLLSQAGSTAP